MMEPPSQAAMSPGAVSGGAVPNTADEDKANKKAERTPQKQLPSSATSAEIARIKDLQSINKKLEEEL